MFSASTVSTGDEIRNWRCSHGQTRSLLLTEEVTPNEPHHRRF